LQLPARQGIQKATPGIFFTTTVFKFMKTLNYKSFYRKISASFASFLLRWPVLKFIFYYIIWELIYMLMGLPNHLASPIKEWDYFLFTYLFMGSVNFLLFYLMAFFVIPRFFIRQKRVLVVVIICIVTAVVFTFVKYKIEVWHFDDEMAKAMESMKNRKPGKAILAIPIRPMYFLYYFITFVWFNFIIVIIAFSYQLLLSWYRQEKVRKELENQKLKAELSFLKLQINPHFLFNSLNNLYSLSVIEKSTKTSDGIMKLSGLIRYMLYEKEDEHYRVNLDNEVIHINNYIDLQKLRLEGDIYIHFSIEGDTNGKKVPSLLLFPLIENAFKHGILQDQQKPVSIQLKVSDKEFYFSSNNYKNNFLKDRTGGIGLGNVRKRLSLLYPGKHTLKIAETDTVFFVELTLPL